MSQDVNDPSQSDKNIPIQLQSKDGTNGQRIIVLTPDMLKQLGLTDTVKRFQSEPKTENNIDKISPLKIDNTVKKIIMHKVLKSSDSSEPHIKSHNTMKNLDEIQGLLKTVRKDVGKHNSSAIQRMKSKSEVKYEQLQDIPKHQIFTNTSNNDQKVRGHAQLKKSTKSNGISQISEGKLGHEESVAKSSPGTITFEKKNKLGLKTYSHNKSLQSRSTSEIVSTRKSTQPKPDKHLNKIASTSTTPLINEIEIFANKKTAKKSSGIKNNQVALSLNKNDSNSSKPSSSSSSSSHTNMLETAKPQDINKFPVSKNNIDKKLLSPVAVKSDSIVKKEKSELSKCLSDVKMNVKKQPAPRTSRRVSKPKVFDDCIYDVSNRRTSTEDRKSDVANDITPLEMNVVKIAQENCSNNPSDNQNEVKKITGTMKSPMKIVEKVTIMAEKSEIVAKPSNEREKNKKQSQTMIASKNIEKLHTIDNKRITSDEPSVRRSLSLPLAQKNFSSFKIPKKNQSKIVNDNLNNSHDKTECEDEKNNVPETAKITEVPNATSVFESPTIKKRCGKPRKYSVKNKIKKSSPLCQEPENETSIMQVTDGIDENPITLNLDSRKSVKEVEVSEKKLDDGEPDVRLPTEVRLEHNYSSTQNQIKNPVKKRGRPPKKKVVDDITKSNPLIEKLDDKSSTMQRTDNINTSSETPELGRSRRTKKVYDIKAKSNDEGSGDEEPEEEEYQPKRTQRRRRGGCRGRGRGRGSVCATDTEFTPRTVGSKSKEKKKEVDDENSNSIEIVCGRCTEKMTREKWINHNLHKHNNMGWREGDPVPDYENNEKLWRSVLATAHKRKKGSLICEKCLVTKKSVFGFISHYNFCGKTDEERDAMKWTCPRCNGVFMPSSQDFHERMHRDMDYKNELEIVRATSNNGEVVGSRKRKAAEKAATRISEFTALVRDEEPAAKKIKVTMASIKDLIEPSQKKNSIPTAWRSVWMKAIAANELAQCRQPGCTFTASTLSEIYEHYDNCKFTPKSTFTCKICKYISEKKKNMKKHVRELHANKIKWEDDSDFLASESSHGSEADEPITELPRVRKPTAAQITPFEKAIKYEDRIAFLRNEKYYHEGNPKMTFVSALRWTLEFELENYCSLVFADFKPNDSTLLTNNEAKNYLPELTVSMRMQQLKNPVMNWEKKRKEMTSFTWKTWHRFESSVLDGFPTFFVGGPVWSMAWLPIPTTLYSENVNQYIAISTHSKMEDSFAAGKSYKFKNMIQIWNLGHLDHSLSHTPDTPQLVYAIAHEKGTIWCMEWCPSGAYENSCATTKNNQQTQNSSPRMGLLAIASSDGCVHIYSLAFPEKLNFEKTDENHLPIYKTDPVVTLQVNQLYHKNNDINWQCTTLSWSKMDGHDTIAAGFSNGYVALWDLSTESPLMLTKKGTTLFITSYRHFFAHKQTVTGITIIPLRGRRFLATVSVDRYAKFWDLEDVSSSVSFVKKGMTVNSTWMTHWPNIVAAYDDVLGLGHTTTYMIGLREPCSKVYPLLPTNSPSFGLAVSDYANGIFHGTSAGELVAIFPFQLYYHRDLEREKLNRKRWLVSSTEIVDLETKAPESVEKKKGAGDKKSNLKEHVYMPDTYDKCSQRFGLVFHNDIDNVKKNLMKKSDRKNPFNSDTMKTIPVEQYNFASINRISWNPNAWSYLWLGIGYQNGFIRILHLKPMSMQNAIMKLLPEYVRKQSQNESEMRSTCAT